MAFSDDDFVRLGDAFQSAALEGEGWYDALAGLAAATGSQTGELIGLGSDAAVPFNIMTNIMTNIDPDFVPAFAAARGGDPAVNPRVRAGMTAPVLQVLSEQDFITPEACRRDPHYQEFAIPWDVPHICLSTLERRDDLLVGLAVVRSHRDGAIDARQRALFAALAPQVRAAVRTQIALEHQGPRLLCAALEALSMAAFVCDRAGLAQAMTPAAEALAAEQRFFALRAGRLQPVDPQGAQAFGEAVAAMLQAPRLDAPALRSVVLRDARWRDSLRLDVVRLPELAHAFTFTPRLLLVARRAGAGDDAQSPQLLRRAFGLSAAEAEVALRIARGDSAQQIALARQTATATVRVQIKAAMAKLGTRRQAQVAARLAALLSKP